MPLLFGIFIGQPTLLEMSPHPNPPPHRWCKGGDKNKVLFDIANCDRFKVTICDLKEPFDGLRASGGS
jgi:hypothetical protein